MDLQKVGDVYVEAKNNIEDDEVTNNNDNSKDLSDFEIAMLKNKKDKKEESEKVKTSIKQFVFGKFANMDIKEEVANSFIEDIYKFNDLHDPSFINVIKIEINIPLKKLAEIAHFVGKSLKWSGDEIAIFCKYAFKESFKNWEIESIKRIASSELSNKKSKK